MMAPSGKTAPGKASPAAAAPTSRPYATSGAELNRPYVPGETAAEQKQAAEGWRWILLAALGVAAVLGYTKVWPAAQHFLYYPSPARDYLLPPSPEPGVRHRRRRRRLVLDPVHRRTRSRPRSWPRCGGRCCPGRITVRAPGTWGMCGPGSNGPESSTPPCR